MARGEAEKPALMSFEEQEYKTGEEDTAQGIAEKSLELSAFLSSGIVDTIRMDSVFPIKDMGVFYSVSLFKAIDGEQSMVYKTDSSVVRMLSHSIKLMDKKDRKKHKTLRKNLKLIKRVAHDPDFWNKPFDMRISH